VAVLESGPELQVSVVDEESNHYSEDSEVKKDARDGQFIVAGLDRVITSGTRGGSDRTNLEIVLVVNELSICDVRILHNR